MVRIETPSFARVLKSEEEFDEMLHDASWIGSPEKSVEMNVLGEYSPLITESVLTSNAYIPEAQVLASFRGISNDELHDLMNDNFEEVERINSKLTGKTYYSDADRLHMIYKNLGINPTSNVLYDASFDELRKDFHNAVLFEKGLSEEDIDILSGGLEGFGKASNAEDAFESLQNDLCFKIDFNYRSGSYRRSEFRCTAYFDSGNIDLDIRGGMDLAKPHVEAYLLNIYEEKSRNDLDSELKYEKQEI